MPTKIPKNAPDRSDTYRANPLLYIRELYTQFTQGLFAALPRGKFHWDKDEQGTEIVITGECPLEPEVLNDRPGISFTRAPIGSFHLGFDDMLSYNFATGKKTKSMLIPGTMVINCCSKVDIESEYLAWVVFEHLWLLRDVLMKRGFYDVGRNLQMGAPSKAGDIVANDQGREWYCTAITSPYHFFRTSSTTPLGELVVQEVRLRMTALTQAIPQPAPASSPSVNPPYQVSTTLPAAATPGSTSHVQRVGVPSGLPVTPHPLNPAQQVVIRPVRADQTGLRPPSINGRAIPLAPASMEESRPATAITTTVKV